MSPECAGLAKELGFKHIRVFLQGLPVWKKGGNSIVASDAHVKTGNIVLIDARFAQEVQEGHIERAVNIPLAMLEDAEDDFPAKKSAPIVVYGKDYDEAKKAAKIISGFGFKTVALVDGGLEGFVKRGNTLVKGMAAEKITWVRKLAANEVTLADFMKATEDNSAQVILDVRSNEEIQSGMFKKAVHIPLDEIENRMSELPKDKEILVHCTTGARAEMAQKAIEKAGLKSRFLLADVECEEGACEATD